MQKQSLDEEIWSFSSSTPYGYGSIYLLCLRNLGLDTALKYKLILEGI